MSYGVNSIQIHKKLRLDKRAGSDNWYARLTLPNGKRLVKTTKTEDVETAKEVALRLYYEVDARIQNKLPATTRKFVDVAKHAINRMETEIREGVGKQAYRDYTQALNKWLIPYFGTTDIAKLDLAAVTAFNAWRTAQSGKVPAQSTINNHNSALNRVLDEAELNGWIVKSLRPTLLNKGTKTQSRGSFSVEEYRVIYTALRTFHKQTSNEKSAATRETLRNYVLFLANTGVRHGTEALGLRWRNIEWYERDGERYLAVNVDGKTNKRTAIARDSVENSLWRQAQLNPRIQAEDFDGLIAAKLDEPVFTTRLSETVTVHNLNRAFNALLDELDLKTGADGRTRTLYSLRHFYATLNLERGVTTHALSRQLGNSTEMIDRHYSKYSPLLNAEVYSGRKKKH
ncbi:site-specific integrase [Planktomarina temperata]|nr:site-specific integrase [Planktomarina temperata]